jgi:hypothetical protein
MIQMLHDLIAELARRSPTIAAMNLAAALPDVALENGLFNVANVPAFSRLATPSTSGAKARC